MIATIINNQDILFSNITAWEEEILDNHFSATNPRSRYIDNSQYQHWDGVYRRFNKSKKRLARPFLAELRKACKIKNLQLVVKDARDPSKRRPMPLEEINDDFLPGITLKDFQLEGIRKTLTTECGVFDITTGGGKSECMAGICKVMDCPTVIIAEQRIVVEQLRERLVLRDICEQPDLFYAGRMPTGQPILIGTIQSLVIPKEPKRPVKGNYKNEKGYRRALKLYEQKRAAFKSREKKAKKIRKIIGTFEMLLVDECDLAVSSTYQKLFRYWFKGRRRYGFTGTPYDKNKPVQKLLLQEHLGSVIVKQNKDQVQASGLIIPLEYVMYAIGNYEDKANAEAYDIAIDEFMVSNEYFHELIAAICHNAAADNERTLILTERNLLAERLHAIIPNSGLVYGPTGAELRRKNLSDFERCKLNVLIGGKNIRRGLDLKGGCEHLILATGGNLASEFDQKLGRARRRNAAGHARVHDFYFLSNKYLYGHSRNRLKAAVSMGYPTHVVFPEGVIDGESLIRARFRKPKRFPDREHDRLRTIHTGRPGVVQA